MIGKPNRFTGHVSGYQPRVIRFLALESESQFSLVDRQVSARRYRRMVDTDLMLEIV